MHIAQQYNFSHHTGTLTVFTETLKNILIPINTQSVLSLSLHLFSSVHERFLSMMFLCIAY